MLSELADNAAVLHLVQQLGQARDACAAVLGAGGILLRLNDLPSFLGALDLLPAARQRLMLDQAGARVDELHQQVAEWTERAPACPELSYLLSAITRRDVDGYATGLGEVRAAQAEQHDERRMLALSRTLTSVHPELLRLLEQEPDDPVWRERDIPSAWAWSRAQSFVTAHRNAAEERRLLEEFETAEDRLRHVTAQLVGLEATRQCMRRMTDDHQRNLNTYRGHMSKIGAGTGKKANEFRRAARAAMNKAQDAVPAWVVPLPNLLDNIAADRNRFDVIIVDEASQVGIEHLYLLWMAPRVIVVGDDKQCTPSANALGQIDAVFKANDEHLAEIDPDIRTNLTPQANLYDLLTNRSGKGALVRLREHFRCVPEIIRWASDQFYQDGSGGSGLIALRERSGDSLPPLRVTKVDGAVIEGKDTRKRNETEARQLVRQLVSCLDDPAYAGKSFGIVVLQSAVRHVQLLEHLINEFVSPEQQQERKIRVGTAPNFQGDERDVVFLSMVVADPPSRTTSTSFRQAYNVAVSRAKDQLWLFTSVGLDQLKSGDLRTSLLGYMLDPPSVFGDSPTLEQVGEHRLVEPFGSLFEQRVFLEVRRRGYHVVPQYPVGRKTLDLVVVGEAGRIAVECDGHYWHSGVSEQENDARRDRELARMGWQTLRIRESEFAFDPDRELGAVWRALEDKGIQPGGAADPGRSGWSPVELIDDDNEQGDSGE